MKSGKAIARAIWLEGQVKQQEAWITQCGGDLAGYIEHYGDPDLEKCYGSGGTAIFAADQAHLEQLKAQLRLAQGTMKPEPEKRLDQGFAVFNCHVNNAKERANAEFIKQFGQEKFDKLIKPYHEAGIMALFSEQPTLYEMAWVVLCTAYVNENRV